MNEITAPVIFTNCYDDLKMIINLPQEKCFCWSQIPLHRFLLCGHHFDQPGFGRQISIWYSAGLLRPFYHRVGCPLLQNLSGTLTNGQPVTMKGRYFVNNNLISIISYNKTCEITVNEVCFDHKSIVHREQHRYNVHTNKVNWADLAFVLVQKCLITRLCRSRNEMANC